jgi:hypothetical protein
MNLCHPSQSNEREDVFVIVVLIGTRKLDDCVRCLQRIDLTKADETGHCIVRRGTVGISGRTSGLCAGMCSIAFSRYRSVTDPTQRASHRDTIYVVQELIYVKSCALRSQNIVSHEGYICSLQSHYKCKHNRYIKYCGRKL